ncbi:hypothetical protein K438DRAFT_315722 [Mycena galopus ATCC 62051]|nr:hypothetical protein K438DRAFT_315722 [Mycena galopus ATCC 62051]
MFQGNILTANDWGTLSKEELLCGKNDPLWDYLATKILSESAAWDFAKRHPSIDLATANPPFVYGPSVPDFLKLNLTRPGSNSMV